MPEAFSNPPASPNFKAHRSKSIDSLPRQVRFDEKSKKQRPGPAPPSAENVNSNKNNKNNKNNNNNNDDDDDDDGGGGGHNTQPDSHPQLGSGLPFLNRPPTWYTAADPTRSVNCQPAFSTTSHGIFPPSHHFSHPLINHQQQPQHFVRPFVSSHIGCHQQSNMGDYQNCVPPPTGLNFQPPVPDTTFGPIEHVYVPRFDGSFQQPAVGPLPVQNTYAMPQPSYIPVPAPQPVMVSGQAYVPAFQGIPSQQPMMAGTPMMTAAAVPGMSVPVGVHAGAPFPIIPGNATSSNVPDISGIGKTSGEETLRQVEFAYNNRLFEPQDFKPSDDDPSRYYYVREIDGNWTQRNRFTIDHMGDCRWYVTDEGWFYAVRLPD